MTSTQQRPATAGASRPRNGSSRANSTGRKRVGHEVLTDEDVWLILSDRQSHEAMARQLGVAAGCVRRVRLGETYRDRWPELPRWTEEEMRGLKPIPDDVVRLILLSDEKARPLAARLGLARQTVEQVRYGMTRPTACPEIPRWEKPNVGASCWNCIHARPSREKRGHETKLVARCTMGFPDPREEGAKFAVFCSVFEARAADDQLEVPE